MTPFQEDVLYVVRNIYATATGFKKRLCCYFLGHDWGEWENSYDLFSLGQHRFCERCKCFNYDNQRLKDFGARKNESEE